jgi:SAM-dependent methyltransferase
MTKQRSWQAFFDAHAPLYMQNEFTHNTIKEVDFLIEELELAPGSRMLDVGCGTGRHSVELARRGFRMTGIDQSTGMLAEARKAAHAAGVEVEWVQADARQFSREGAFDGALCLCEGAFGLLEASGEAVDQPLGILRNVSRSLKPGAKVALTVLNGFWMARRYTQADVERGTFDPLTFSDLVECAPAEGHAVMRVRQRAFVPTELTLLLQCAGLRSLHIWGGTAGSWNRGPVNLDEIEIMVIAEHMK